MKMYLPLIYVCTGALNVLLLKWSDTLEGECSDGKWRRFQHPLVQTALMFLGEILCFFVYRIVYFFLQRRGLGAEGENIITRGEREFSPLRLLVPAILDAIASVMLLTGLYLTYVSSFQMLRVAALIFVGIFGAIHLNQMVTVRHWMAMFTIICGIIVIISIDVERAGYDQFSLPRKGDSNAVLTGNLLVVFAQIFHAGKFIYDEKYLKGTDIPTMLATGWQGIFGLCTTVLLGACLTFLPSPMPLNNNTRGVFDDLSDIVPQIHSNPTLLAPLIIFIISSACYNFASLTIVKYSSSANRLLADGLRILIIWWMAFLLEWEMFNLITVIGFLILQMGSVAYRNAIFIEWYRSLLARLMRSRYADLTVETGNDSGEAGVSTNRPADAI
ncbi:solute carrier family 35 member F6 [Anastrepha ludens]|uniref:solute carrier family 35 member F6 n=1 Tax=Anastrepha ludens TaxID=28586 RepID=UPI0023B02C3D|nr:solute carrier family 35 member F6 [Anastrepha ludens]